MLLSTLDAGDYAKYEVKRHMGIVYGNAIRSAGIISDMMGKLTDLFGGQSKSYETELEKAQQEALTRLMQTAERHNANAVFGIKFSVACLPMSRGGLFIITALGTAVVVEETTPSGKERKN